MKKTVYSAIGETICEEELENGLRIIVCEKPQFQSCHALFSTHYGGADRRFCVDGSWLDTPAGIAHFLEHKMFDMPDGTNILPVLSSRGAAPNAFTGSDMTGYHFTCTTGFEENLRTLLSFVMTPYYTEQSVRKEQGIIGQEIRMTENSPGYSNYHQLLQTLFVRHPLRESVAGTVESIAEITPELLYACHGYFYRPCNMVLCCVGRVSAERVIAIAKELLPAKRESVPMADYGEAEDLLPRTDRAESRMAVSAPQFLIGAKLPKVTGRESLRQQLLSELSLDCLIGEASPLYGELYEAGLINRSFSAEVVSNCGEMLTVLGGESKGCEQVLEKVNGQVARLAGNGLDKARFERCRRAAYGRELSALDTPSQFARTLTRGAFAGWNALELFSLMEEFTVDDAVTFLCENLLPERMAMSVIRPIE